ncbi:MAG: prolipoprotein diacylglyceryl transferase [Clostridia bacterium]|nr:prolipoprotein diacylglyceryl transferase [Clostridia bacterium]
MNVNALLWPNHPYITVFGVQIYWYAIIIVLGMLAAFVVISLLFKRRNMSADLFMTFFVICLPIAILTTRIFYCITDGMPITEWFSWESLRSGGLSIVGGIIGGTVSVAVVAYVKKVNFLRVGDCVVVGLLLAQSIGRWGNFVNQEVYGAVVNNEALQFFPFAVYIEGLGEWHYAFFFYESMATLTAAILLFLNAWKNPYKPNGVNSACYFIVYGGVRSIMEPLRDPTFILNGGGVPWSLVFSLLMFVGGVIFLTVVLLLNRKKEGKLIGSIHGEPYGITKFIPDSKEEVEYKNNLNMMCAIYPENYPEQPAKGEKTEEKSLDLLKAWKEKAKALFGKQSEKKAEEPQETKQEDATEKSQDEEQKA